MDEFDDMEQGAEVYRRFFTAMTRGGIEPVVKAAYELLGRPVFVGDDTGAVIYQLPADNESIPNWNDIHKQGTLRQDDYLTMYADLSRDPIPFNMPVMVKDRFMVEGYQVVCAIERGGVIAAVATVLFNDCVPTPSEMRVLQVFASAVRPALLRLRAQDEPRKERLALVLEETDVQSARYGVALSALRKKLDGPFQVLFVEAATPEDRSVFGHLRQLLNSNVFRCLATEVGSWMAVLVYGSLPNDRKLDQALALMRKYPIRIGISVPFDDIASVRDHFFQAKVTLLAGKTIAPEETVYEYEKHSPYQMGAAVALSGATDVFVHPAVRALAEHDEKHDSNWLQTVEVYLYNNMSKQKTADELHVHPNTLTYRLARIKELFGIDCDDLYFRAVFYISDLALKFRNVDFSAYR